MKRLLIKASGITSPSWRGYNSGVGRSTFLLLDALSKKNLPFELQVYANGLSTIGFDFFNWPFKTHKFPLPEKYGCRLTNIESHYRHLFMRNDLLHIPHNLDTILPSERYVVTLHDVIAYDKAMADKDRYEMGRWKKMAANAVGIMTCSEFSKGEIVEKLHIPEDKVSVVYWGICRDKFYIEDETTMRQKLTKLGIDFPYFISVSCAHPRKNIRTLLKAFRRFCTGMTAHRLILVWGNPPQDILEEYSKEIRDKRIVFLNYVSDEDLVSLYNGATCTMFPTRSEGFGFPILESFACGTPIMTCKNSCLEEVGKDVAIYVGEDDIAGMTDVMSMFEQEKYNMDTFAKDSAKLLEAFSWDKTADKYIEFYEQYI